jgi:hypothetical protein
MKKIITVLAFAALSVALPSHVFAATVTKVVPLVPLDPSDSLTNPHSASSNLNMHQNPNMIFSQPASATATSQQSGLNGGSNNSTMYSWKVDMSQVCQGAQVQALSAAASVTTGPDFQVNTDGAVMLVSTNGQMLEVTPTDVSGLDGAATVPGFLPQGSVIRGLVGGQAAGPIGATWNGVYNASSTVLHINQATNVNAPTTWMQTDISQVAVTYDDAACVTAATTTNLPQGSSTPASATAVTKLAATGQSVRTLGVASVILVVTGFAVLRFWKRRAESL